MKTISLYPNKTLIEKEITELLEDIAFILVIFPLYEHRVGTTEEYEEVMLTVY